MSRCFFFGVVPLVVSSETTLLVSWRNERCSSFVLRCNEFHDNKEKLNRNERKKKNRKEIRNEKKKEKKRERKRKEKRERERKRKEKEAKKNEKNKIQG